MSAFRAAISLYTSATLIDAYEKRDQGKDSLVTMTDKEYEKICLVKDRTNLLTHFATGVMVLSGGCVGAAAAFVGASISLPLALTGLLGMALSIGLGNTLGNNFRAAASMLRSKRRPVTTVFNLPKLDEQEIKRRTSSAPSASPGPNP